MALSLSQVVDIEQIIDWTLSWHTITYLDEDGVERTGTLRKFFDSQDAETATVEISDSNTSWEVSVVYLASLLDRGAIEVVRDLD